MNYENNIFREGSVHVMADKCSTCIFRRGNLMNLSRGRVASMVAAAKASEGTIVCHKTLGTDANAACRGFFDKHATAPLQVADRLGFITFVQEEV